MRVLFTYGKRAYKFLMTIPHLYRKCAPDSSVDSSREPKLRKASTLKNRTLDRMRTPGDMDNTFERIRVGDMDLYSVPTTPVFDAIRSDNLTLKLIHILAKIP